MESGWRVVCVMWCVGMVCRWGLVVNVCLWGKSVSGGWVVECVYLCDGVGFGVGFGRYGVWCLYGWIIGSLWVGWGVYFQCQIFFKIYDLL